MTVLALFLQFMKIGLFAFGGAYGAIPLIRETVLSQGWMDEGELMTLLGISESTPGPIMVNAATMTGFRQAGIPGAAAATLGVVLPSFLIMLLIPRLQKKWGGHRVIRLALRGAKPCIAAVICATGIRLLLQLLFPDGASPFPGSRTVLILGILLLASGLWRRFRHQPLPPIYLIVFSAVLGVLIY